MPKKVFISFRGEDEFKVWTLRNLASFQNVDFDMDDVSLRNAINSKDDGYIRSVIRPKVESCDICLCLIGENTHRSRKWVPWELELAAVERKKMIAMRFNGMSSAVTPATLTRLGVVPFDWDLTRLARELA